MYTYMERELEREMQIIRISTESIPELQFSITNSRWPGKELPDCFSSVNTPIDSVEISTFRAFLGQHVY